MSAVFTWVCDLKLESIRRKFVLYCLLICSFIYSFTHISIHLAFIEHSPHTGHWHIWGQRYEKTRTPSSEHDSLVWVEMQTAIDGM